MATAIERRFQLAEQKLRRAESEREQQEKEALRRRFASIGGLGSGASIKAEQQAGEAASRRIAAGRSEIEMQRLAEEARQEEIASQRAFQTSEREAGQTFGAQQAALGREFQTSERKSSQTFSAEQAALARRWNELETEKQRAFAKGEREAGQAFAAEQAAVGREFQKTEREAAQVFAADQAALTRELEARKVAIGEGELQMSEIVSAFNMGNLAPFRKWLQERGYSGTGTVGSGSEITDVSKYAQSPDPIFGKGLSMPRATPDQVSKLPDEMFFSTRQRDEAMSEYQKLINEGVSPELIQISLDPTNSFGGKYWVTVKRREIQPGQGGVGGIPYGGITGAATLPTPAASKPKIDLSGLKNLKINWPTSLKPTYKAPQPGPISIF